MLRKRLQQCSQLAVFKTQRFFSLLLSQFSYFIQLCQCESWCIHAPFTSLNKIGLFQLLQAWVLYLSLQIVHLKMTSVNVLFLVHSGTYGHWVLIVYDKGLLSIIHKEILELNNRKTNNPIKTWSKTLYRQLCKKIQTGNKHVKGCSP